MALELTGRRPPKKRHRGLFSCERVSAAVQVDAGFPEVRRAGAGGSVAQAAWGAIESPRGDVAPNLDQGLQRRRARKVR
nr:hypothetical protein JVH1_4127 [Rhodococcus sp. JVH1]